jgi:chromosome partitioning protein
MKVAAVFNQKGGVGKTTIAVNLSVALASLNCKTVFIDMDFQSDGTRQLWHGDYPKLTVYDVLAQRCGAEDAALETEIPNLSVIASSPRLSLVDAGDDRAGAYQTELRDNGFPRGGVDFVIIDCPPSLGRLTANALNAASLLLLPVTPSPFAMEGMKRTLGIVESVRQGLNPDLRDYRICLSMMDQTPVSRAIAADIAGAHGDRVLPTHVAFDRDVNKAAICKTPAILFNPDSRFARSIAAITVEFAAALGANLPADAIADQPKRLGSLHDSLAGRFKGLGAGAGADGSAEAEGGTAGRRRSRGGYISSFMVGSAIGAAVGFFTGAHL